MSLPVEKAARSAGIRGRTKPWESRQATVGGRKKQRGFPHLLIRRARQRRRGKEKAEAGSLKQMTAL